MNKNEYAAAAAEEKSRYDGNKDHVEAVGEQLPSTKLGSEARAKALTEGRLKTNKQARLAGAAPDMPSEKKRREHIEAMYARYHPKK